MANFMIDNMTCNGCVKGVTATVRQADPAAEVEVNLERRQLRVSSGRADETALLRALEADGWRARTVTA